MIEEVYVSLEVARLLREKRFDETCRAYWGEFIDKPLYLCECNRGKFFDYCRNSWLKINVCDDEQDYMTAPTQQMAMKWLREVHNLFIEIKYATSLFSQPHTTIYFQICYMSLDYNTSGKNMLPYNYIREYYTSYEEACEAAIKYCLEHLI